jgi:beta-glucosidase
MTHRTPTRAEQASLSVGASAWRSREIVEAGIRSVLFSDGPHGVRLPHESKESSLFDSLPATCFPSSASLGSTWNRALAYRVGEALGREAAAAQIDVLLAPGLNLKRNPAGGRNFEYFSEDPLLTAELGASYVDGLQGTGVGASVKHFIANDTEGRRYGIDVRVDDRALRELYLSAFEKPVVRARPATVMAAYSKLNGTHCTENSWLLTDLLRGEWGFTGAVISDWGASWDRTRSVPAGLDLEMPGLGDDRAFTRAVDNGAVDAAALSRVATNISGLAARPQPEAVPADFDAHHDLARQAAAEGAVLLQNARGLLPLDPGVLDTVAVVGAFAAAPRYQGAGSSHVVPTRLSTVRAALEEQLGAAVSYADGYHRESDDVDTALLREAVAVATDASVVVVVVGLPEAYESEGVDRAHLRLPPAHNELVRAVAAVNANVVVVLQNGSPVEMPWRAEVSAILETHLGGQAGGDATADILLGVREPGGRLAETFPNAFDDHPAAHIPTGPTQLEYWESLYVGYRYFDTASVPVTFPFGHGLSYTSFDWSEPVVDASALDALAAAAAADATSASSGAEWTIECSVQVTNTGSRAGSEVVQLYVHALDATTVYRPDQELRAFDKVWLEPGESAVVRLRLDARAFAFWDVATQGWAIDRGRYELRVGASSRDIRSAVVVTLPGTERVDPRTDDVAYRAVAPGHRFTREAFAHLYGHALPDNTAPRGGQFTLDTSLRDMSASRVARALTGLVRAQAIKTLGIPGDDASLRIIDDVVGQFTLRVLPTISGGTFTRRLISRTLWLINATSRTRKRTIR